MPLLPYLNQHSKKKKSLSLRMIPDSLENNKLHERLRPFYKMVRLHPWQMIYTLNHFRITWFGGEGQGRRRSGILGEQRLLNIAPHKALARLCTQVGARERAHRTECSVLPSETQGCKKQLIDVSLLCDLNNRWVLPMLWHQTEA